MNILKSSVDANKWSTTVKGFLMVLVPVIMMVTGISEAELSGVIDLISQVVFFGASLFGAAQMLYGLSRKIYMGRWSAAG